MQAAILSAFFLKQRVEVDGVFLQDRRIAGGCQGEKVPGSVPGRSGRQFLPLKQNHVLPAPFGQMIENAAPDDTTTNDDHSGV
jgi:hypothetical protein